MIHARSNQITDDQIRIAVAEVMGLEEINVYFWRAWRWGCRGGNDRVLVQVDVPNYPTNLNACAEFEATLNNSKDGTTYAYYLSQIVLGWSVDTEYVLNGWSLSRVAWATARQRCLAFLRVRRPNFFIATLGRDKEAP